MKISLPEIQRSVECYYGLATGDLKKHNKSPVYSDPRQVFMYIADKYSGLSPAEIARYLNRDRTTILYGIKRISQFLEFDLKTIKAVRELEKE